MSAFLIGFIDVLKSPPTVVSVGIYSEEAYSLTSTSALYAFDIFQVSENRGDTSYHMCHQSMIEFLAEERFLKAYSWVIPLLDKLALKELEKFKMKKNMNEALE